MKRIPIYILLLTSLGSCFDQGDCSDVSTNDMKVGFYNFSDRKEKTVALDSVLIEGSDSVFYKAKSTSSIVLPLNPETESIVVRLYFASTVSILEVKYKIKSFALAPDCVAIDLYTVDEATAIGINEVFFAQKSITQSGTENLRLYF